MLIRIHIGIQGAAYKCCQPFVIPSGHEKRFLCPGQIREMARLYLAQGVSMARKHRRTRRKADTRRSATPGKCKFVPPQTTEAFFAMPTHIRQVYLNVLELIARM